MTKTTQRRPFSAGMSTPPSSPTPAESRPSPWLSVVITVAISLLGLAVQWGTQGAELRALERRTNVVESDVARVSATQASAAAQSARIEARLDGMERELSRLARAVERLTDAPATSARSVP